MVLQLQLYGYAQRHKFSWCTNTGGNVLFCYKTTLICWQKSQHTVRLRSYACNLLLKLKKFSGRLRWEGNCHFRGRGIPPRMSRWRTRHRVAYNEIITIGMPVSFIILLLQLSVNATLLQAVYVLLVW